LHMHMCANTHYSHARSASWHFETAPSLVRMWGNGHSHTWKSNDYKSA
jgi:hypothetical protein